MASFLIVKVEVVILDGFLSLLSGLEQARENAFLFQSTKEAFRRRVILSSFVHDLWVIVYSFQDSLL